MLVGLRAHRDLRPVTRLLARVGSAVRPLERIGVIAVTARPPALVTRLAGDRRIAFVEPNRTLEPAGDAYDAIDPETGISFSWAYDAVRAGEALAAVGGGSSREIAIIDTGLDVLHPDLFANVDRWYDTASRRQGVADVKDLNGHGTFVAGLIAAVDGNGIGGKGVAGRTDIYAVRASRGGNFRVEDVIRGLDWAIRNEADVVNLSLAGDTLSEAESRALSSLFEADVLPVAAAGNRGREGNRIEFPAAAIAGRRGAWGTGLSVAATRPDGRPADFSSRNDFVSIAAPGAGQRGCSHGVFSTIPRNSSARDRLGACSQNFGQPGDETGRWGYGQGTSFAAPIVAGIASLAWQANRELDSDQVASVLMRSARQTVAGARWNAATGRGVVDGAAAVALARRYDTTAPPVSISVRAGRAVLRVAMRASRDRTRPGRELAGRVRYGVAVSTNGRTYRRLLGPSRRPPRGTLRLRRGRRYFLLASACDANGNCSLRKLGPYRNR